MSTLETTYPDAQKELDHLIRLTNDSIQGLEAAANHVKDDFPSLATTFLSIGEDRRQVVNSLNSVLASSNHKVEDDGTVLGTAHRYWLKLREMVTSNSAKNVLAEAVRGEHELRDTYQEVLEKSVGTSLHDIVSQAYAVIERGITQIENANSVQQQT